MSLTNVFLCSIAGEWLSVIASCCLDRDMRVLGWSPYEKNFSRRHLVYTSAKLVNLYALHNTRKGRSVEVEVFAGRILSGNA